MQPVRHYLHAGNECGNNRFYMEDHINLPSLLRARRVPFSQLLCIIFLFIPPSASHAAYQVVAPFWAAKIDSALGVRDVYFKSLLPDTSTFSLMLLNKIQRQMVCDRLVDHPDTSSPWHYFFSGMLACSQKGKDAAAHFATALSKAQQDPGTTWALFVEFTRNRQDVWAERCLMRLEKLFLASGARSAPAIAQQLLFYADTHEKEKELTKAFSYYGWAERFDPNQPWSALHRLWNCIPSHLKIFFSTLSSLANTLAGSWTLQLAFLSHMYDWLRAAFLILTLVLFAGLGIKYLPRAVHPVVDRLPDSVPVGMRTMLPIAVLCSFISFGLLPFLWLIAFIVWPLLMRRERILITLALLLLVVSPFFVRVHDMFLQARSLQGSLSLFSRASQEGYLEEMHQLALKKVIINPSDALAHLSVALYASKLGDTAASRLSMEKALTLRPSDRVMTTFAGNIAFLAGDNNRAVAYYQQVLTNNSTDMVSRFNLSQCYARHSDTTVDLDFLKILSKNEQNRINDYVNKNNVYFSKSWPLARQIMNPEYSVRDFWFSIFPLYNGSWATARSLWGGLFFGIPPLISFYIFALLFLSLFAWSLSPAFRKQMRHQSFCRLCKRPVCAYCKKGELCSSCAQMTQYIRNVKTLAAIQSGIIRNRTLLHHSIAHALDIVLPGSGMLFSSTASIPLTALVIVFTCMIYASIVVMTGLHLAYPHWIAYNFMEQLPFLLLTYNGIFVIRALFSLLRKRGMIFS
ncbi:MAG: hypothetical protein JW768_08675 [Chitinispirillaceae bacterium]|nr:hypothetical protein [Chitinispirillaceae bacterium]